MNTKRGSYSSKHTDGYDQRKTAMVRGWRMAPRETVLSVLEQARAEFAAQTGSALRQGCVAMDGTACLVSGDGETFRTVAVVYEPSGEWQGIKIKEAQ